MGVEKSRAVLSLLKIRGILGPVGSDKRQATRLANAEKVKSTARGLLADRGAAALSLREVAREMGQTSSALYRYFATRDELLTALIIDAYNDLGAATERAEARVARADHRGRFRAACRAIRKWAIAHPHEYALIFGTPIPGYEAPQLTVDAAIRVTAVIASVVSDQFEGDTTHTPIDPSLERALWWENVALLMPHVPRDVALRAIYAWTQIFGFISFELFGHLVGTVRQADRVFDALIDEIADRMHVLPAKR